jgi:protoporphyrinogen oxidase
MKNVVIIGAGPAGLTAAYELLRDAPSLFDVVILEETDEVGGISRTQNISGDRMDIGPHRFFSKEPRVVKLWEHLMPTQGFPGPDPEKTDRVMLIKDRITRIYYGGSFYDYPVALNWNTIKNMGFFTLLKAGFSYLHSIFFKRNENSLENFYINRFGQVLYSMFFEKYTEKLWGRHPSNISPDWGAQRVKGLSIAAIFKDIFYWLVPHKKRKTETSLIEYFYYPKMGSGALYTQLANEIINIGGHIIFNAKANRFGTFQNKVVSLEYMCGGKTETINADYFISSMPIVELAVGLSEIPDAIKSIAAGLPYREFIEVSLLVSKLKLKNTTKIKTVNDIIPDQWIYVQEPSVKIGRMQIVNNWSQYMLKDHLNTVFLGVEYFCSEGDDFWNLEDDKIVKFAEEELVKMGMIDAGTILKPHVVRQKKAYPAYFDTYQDLPQLIAYINTFENLFCIGRNGQHRYNNMDHSIMTGFEAADNIKHGILDKTNIWNVNTEREYHEENK